MKDSATENNNNNTKDDLSFIYPPTAGIMLLTSIHNNCFTIIEQLLLLLFYIRFRWWANRIKAREGFNICHIICYIDQLVHPHLINVLPTPPPIYLGCYYYYYSCNHFPERKYLFTTPDLTCRYFIKWTIHMYTQGELEGERRN